MFVVSSFLATDYRDMISAVEAYSRVLSTDSAQRYVQSAPLLGMSSLYLSRVRPRSTIT